MTESDSDTAIGRWIKEDVDDDKEFDDAVDDAVKNAAARSPPAATGAWEACVGRDALTSMGEATKAHAFQTAHSRKHTVGHSGVVLAQAAAAADYASGAHASALNLVDSILDEQEEAATRIQARFRGGRTRRTSQSQRKSGGGRRSPGSRSPSSRSPTTTTVQKGSPADIEARLNAGQRGAYDKAGRAARTKHQGCLVRLRDRCTENFMRVRDIFFEIDASGDGTLSRQEFKRGVAEILGYYPSRAGMREILEVFDRNNDGAINYKEFLGTLKDLKRDADAAKEELRAKRKIRKVARRAAARAVKDALAAARKPRTLRGTLGGLFNRGARSSPPLAGGLEQRLAAAAADAAQKEAFAGKSTKARLADLANVVFVSHPAVIDLMEHAPGEDAVQAAASPRLARARGLVRDYCPGSRFGLGAGISPHAFHAKVNAAVAKFGEKLKRQAHEIRTAIDRVRELKSRVLKNLRQLWGALELRGSVAALCEDWRLLPGPHAYVRYPQVHRAACMTGLH